jgi:hypothetical protein
MLEKLRRSLADDIAPLLPAGIQFHDKATLDAFNHVWTELITQIKGDPWKLSGRGITQHQDAEFTTMTRCIND